MRLLLDENLSVRLPSSLADVYPEMTHVHEVGLGAAQDDDVWAYARKHGFVIVSKDSDFAERSVLEPDPPKVIWIRLGNALRRTWSIYCVPRSRSFAPSSKKMQRHACSSAEAEFRPHRD